MSFKLKCQKKSIGFFHSSIQNREAFKKSTAVISCFLLKTNWKHLLFSHRKAFDVIFMTPREQCQEHEAAKDRLFP